MATARGAEVLGGGIQSGGSMGGAIILEEEKKEKSMAKERTREEILKENTILWDIANDFNNHFLKMQADCIRYLEPDNKCGEDWLVSRMLFHLDGPEQRRV